MPSFVMRGPEGTLVWGYQRAARVTGWTIATAPDGLHLTGTLVQADPFRLAQSPLTFRVSRQNGSAWTWPVRELHIAADALTALLVPQE